MGERSEQNGHHDEAVGNGEIVPEAEVEQVDVIGPEQVEGEEEQDAPTTPKVVDKRRFARLLGFGFGAGGQGGEADAEPARERLPAYVEELKERAERVQAEARAETDAARARLERHYEGRLASARADVVEGILPVLDNLDRALAVEGAQESPLFEGVAATRDLFLKKLVELGVEQVPAEGESFDPEVHEAVDSIDVDNEDLDGRIIELLRRGFRMGERLVRPSIVRVGRFTGGSTDE
jgi:molecular chaperone GrpE